MSNPPCHRDWLGTARLSFPELVRFHSPEMARHVVQFYHDEAIIVGNVAYLAAKVLGAGSAVVMVATQEHLDQIAALLAHSGSDLGIEQKLGRLVIVDAAEALSNVMVNDHPDEAAFDRTIGTIMRKAAERSATGFVFAFGEMVALLCAADNLSGAVRLEQLWNVLAERQRFSLYCAYPLNSLEKNLNIDALVEITAEHALTIPGEKSS